LIHRLISAFLIAVAAPFASAQSFAIGDAQPLMLKMNYLSPVKKLASPLRGAKLLFVDPGADSAEVERCDNAYDALIRTKN
jgi:hypothetical protein